MESWSPAVAALLNLLPLTTTESSGGGGGGDAITENVERRRRRDGLSAARIDHGRQ